MDRSATGLVFLYKMLESTPNTHKLKLELFFHKDFIDIQSGIKKKYVTILFSYFS